MGAHLAFGFEQCLMAEGQDYLAMAGKLVGEIGGYRQATGRDARNAACGAPGLPFWGAEMPAQALLDGRAVAGEGGAADVADLVAVEAAGAVHCRAVVPHDEVVGPPGVREDDFSLGGVLGGVAREQT